MDCSKTASQRKMCYRQLKKGYEHCFTEFGSGRPEKLSEEAKQTVMENSAKRQRSYIEADERYQNVCAQPSFIGVFICFTAIELMWVIKESGTSWNRAYYGQFIPTKTVFPFLSNPKKVFDPEEVVYLHDHAPYHKTNATQQLLKDSDIDSLILFRTDKEFT
ncbi:unnamed protein product [Adineta ricciae]|uniref:Transposase n=1 Tax=Adineta ricciae TaxID=249248 RepID=A0A815V4N4_ADIRI|nr:unnamed protein product [Adineta ricciae]CAF1587073.1 unnamed protein product [Adineta ricciae]